MATIRDLCLSIGSGSTPSRKRPEFFIGDIPWLKTKELADATVFDTEEKISTLALEKSSCKLLPAGAVVMAMYGATVGKLGILGREMTTNQACCAMVTNPDRLDNRYLFYWLKRNRREIQDLSNGAAQQNLSVRTVGAIEIEPPPVGEQVRIGRVLGSLDDKIAANNDVVSASNELIRNLYRALPESSRTLNEVASLAKNNEQPHRFLPDKRLVGLEHFDPKSLWLPRSSEPETATSAKTKFQAGDTLFGKLRPYFHKVAIAPFDGYCSTDILVLRAEDPLHSPLVAAAANSDAVVQQAVNSSNGTRMPRAKWTDIEGCPIPDPDAPATLEFIDFAATLIQDATARLEENKALAKTRDELLPLLMSGKITVREAGQEAAAAGAQIPSEENEV